MRSEYDFAGGVRGTYYEAYQARSRKLKQREKLMLFQQVVLCQNCPEQKLKSGDKAILLDFISYVDSREEGCILEVSGENGEVRKVAVPVLAVAFMRSGYDLRHLEVWKKVHESNCHDLERDPSKSLPNHIE